MASTSVTETLDFTEFGNVIGGIVSKTVKTRSSINPSTGESLFDAPVSTAKDVDDAVKAARKAFPAWSRKSMDERSELLLAYAAAIDDHIEAFSNLLTLEQGKPVCIRSEVPL